MSIFGCQNLIFIFLILKYNFQQSKTGRIVFNIYIFQNLAKNHMLTFRVKNQMPATKIITNYQSVILCLIHTREKD